MGVYYVFYGIYSRTVPTWPGRAYTGLAQVGEPYRVNGSARNRARAHESKTNRTSGVNTLRMQGEEW